MPRSLWIESPSKFEQIWIGWAEEWLTCIAPNGQRPAPANRYKAWGTKRFRQDWLWPACLEGNN
jgi:hypothetical protein